MKAAAAALAKVTTVKPPKRWICDTGCGANLVGKQDYSEEELTRKKKLPNPQTLDTANGEAAITHTVPIDSVAMGRMIEALLCDETPAALSVGILCVLMGVRLPLESLSR